MDSWVVKRAAERASGVLMQQCTLGFFFVVVVERGVVVWLSQQISQCAGHVLDRSTYSLTPKVIHVVTVVIASMAAVRHDMRVCSAICLHMVYRSTQDLAVECFCNNQENNEGGS